MIVMMEIQFIGTIRRQDCDGILSVDDCDDGDATTVNDMDRDGVLSVDDCDDGDIGLLAQSQKIVIVMEY